MADSKKAVLLFDSVSWVEDGARRDHDGKGTEVELPAVEFDRLEKLGAVASPRSKDAKAAAENGPQTTPDPPGGKPIEKMTIAELLEHAEKVGVPAETLVSFRKEGSTDPKPGVAKATVADAIKAHQAAAAK